MCTHRIHHHTVKQLWQALPPAAPQQLPLLDYHSYAERSQARLEVITLYAQGWSKRSISRFLHVSRPTITAWIARFEAENLESLERVFPAHYGERRTISEGYWNFCSLV